MSVFVLLTTKETPPLEEKIKQVFSNDQLKIAPNQWLVASSELKTTKEIVTAVGGAQGEFGQIVAFAVSGYWGWHRTDIWEWIKARWEQT